MRVPEAETCQALCPTQPCGSKQVWRAGGPEGWPPKPYLVFNTGYKGSKLSTSVGLSQFPLREEPHL